MGWWIFKTYPWIKGLSFKNPNLAIQGRNPKWYLRFPKAENLWFCKFLNISKGKKLFFKSWTLFLHRGEGRWKTIFQDLLGTYTKCFAGWRMPTVNGLFHNYIEISRFQWKFNFSSFVKFPGFWKFSRTSRSAGHSD